MIHRADKTTLHVFAEHRTSVAVFYINSKQFGTLVIANWLNRANEEIQKSGIPATLTSIAPGKDT